MRYIRKFLVLFFSLLLLIGCSSDGKAIKSIKGEISEIDKERNTVLVECTDYIYLIEEDKLNTMAYLCTVKINEDTSIRVQNTDEEISINKLTEGQTIKVILSNPKEMNKEVESRTITAKEILVY